MEDVARRRRPLRLVAGWLPVALYAAGMFYLSSRPGGSMPRWSFLRHDKVLHCGEYTGFGFLVGRALAAGGLGGAAGAAATVGAVMAFGVSDEYHQTFVPGRSGNDLGDLTADLCGATLGAVAHFLIGRRARRPAEA